MDDLELGEVCGHVVEMRDRPGSLELVPHAAGSPGSGSGEPHVEHHDDAQILARLPDRIERLVVREELLAHRVQLTDALDPELRMAPPDLFDGCRSFVRIDACERDEHVGVGFDGRADEIVGRTGHSRDRLVVGVAQHGHHLALPEQIGLFGE